MDFEFTPDEKAYQKEMCEFLSEAATPEVTAEADSMQGMDAAGKALLRKLGERRLLTPSWPREYGGRGLSATTQVMMFDEMACHKAPWPLDGIVAGPTILRFGTEEQKKKYLPAISSGEIEFALGYTEPDAGSDLASLNIRAVKSGDEYILNGQKVFNTESHYSDYHWLLVRTDPTLPKHKGLSIFIVDLHSPGITIKPLITQAGLRTNEVFYEDVRVPKENLLGEINKGWVYANSALSYERIIWTGDIRQRFDRFLKHVLNDDRYKNIWSENSCTADELAELHIKLHIGELLGYKVASLLDNGARVTFESSINKVFVTEARKHLFTALMQIAGHYGELLSVSKWAELDGMLPRELLDTARWTIVAGSSEIHRNIIALSGLGMPRK